MFFSQEGFTFRNFVVDAFTIFVFIVWFWLLISVASDLFRRHDISGWAKAIWVIVLVVAPYIGVLAYLFSRKRHGRAQSSASAGGARGAPARGWL
jgi:Phospholipase_D-nuclease N-terminal